jgi:hypothetical protein
MKPARNFTAVFFVLSASLLSASVLPARAQYQPARASVRAVHGSATYSIDGNWQSLKENTTLTAGAIIKTAPDTTMDLFLPDSRTVLRLMPDSVLRFDRLDKMPAGELGLTMTRLSLLSGTLIGSQHKLARPSEFEVRLPNGVAKIVGTEYSVRADGTVACLSGTVSVAYNPPGNGSPVSVSVAAGFSSDPATCKTVPTSTAYLQNITPDIQAVRNNDEAFNDGRKTVVVDHCCEKMSPTHGQHGGGCGNGDGHGNGDSYGNGDGHGNGDGKR